MEHHIVMVWMKKSKWGWLILLLGTYGEYFLLRYSLLPIYGLTAYICKVVVGYTLCHSKIKSHLFNQKELVNPTICRWADSLLTHMAYYHHKQTPFSYMAVSISYGLSHVINKQILLQGSYPFLLAKLSFWSGNFLAKYDWPSHDFVPCMEDL